MSTLTASTNRVATLLAPPFAAVQFLTRIRTPYFPFDSRTLPRAAAWFPVVGTLLALVAAFAHHLLAPHVPRSLSAILVVALLVALTGALHEDGLADCADAFGLPRSRERTLAILHDPAIGSFGACALAITLFTRVALLTALPVDRVAPTLIAALALSRWSILPLSLLPSATPASGRGSSIARQVSTPALLFGSLYTVLIVVYALRSSAFAPVLATLIVTAITAAYYRRRLGGTTGDCFGATVQLVEITILFCGVWHA